MPAGPYEPTPLDICKVRALMVARIGLPEEIVDSIFDFAEYWAHSSNYIDYMEEHKDPLRIAGGCRLENRFLLRSLPVGLTSLREDSGLTETLAYDTNEAKPLPYKEQNDHQPDVFKRLAKHAPPRLEHPVRKVVFTVKSKDQGWVGGEAIKHKGSYKASWTWFEAGLERFDSTQQCDKNCVADLRYEKSNAPAPDLPLCSLRPVVPDVEQIGDNGEWQYIHQLAAKSEHEIQRNRLARREWQENEIEWRWDDDLDGEVLDEAGRGRDTGNGEFVRNLKLGDVVTIWGKARFRGWVNHVQKVKVDVYWAV